MTVITEPHEHLLDDLFVDLETRVGHRLLLKCEGLNFAGSVKLKAAAEMVAAAERQGTLRPGSIIVESSSGNLGVALAMIAASSGYEFVCVTDARCNLATRRAMQAYGAHLVVVTEPDPESGFLGARLRTIEQMCLDEPRCLWLNQYVNQHNWQAHYRQTAPAISSAFDPLDVLFVGAGTCGTLMGCARWFRDHRPEVRVVAVDSHGSVSFGDAPGPRMIPGIGAGVVPPALDHSLVDDVVLVHETETVQTCQRLARRGFLFGGSTGTVVSGACRWLDLNDPGRDLTSVAISPDLGDRYLDTVYDPDWVQDTFPAPAVPRQARRDVAPRPLVGRPG